MPLTILSNLEIYSLMPFESNVDLIEDDFKHANIAIILLPYHPELLQFCARADRDSNESAWQICRACARVDNLPD
jgi:hypothetical protein